jgi:hypothetical protein
MAAVVTLLIIVTLSLLVTRIATVALTLTGMSREQARFQARSALTGTGFTTSEAEEVTNHPVRRRIVLFLMLVLHPGDTVVLYGPQETLDAIDRRPKDRRGDDEHRLAETRFRQRVADLADDGGDG